MMGGVDVGGGDWEEVVMVVLDVPKLILAPVPTPKRPVPSDALTAPNPPPDDFVEDCPNIPPFVEDDPKSGVVFVVAASVVVLEGLVPKNPAWLPKIAGLVDVVVFVFVLVFVVVVFVSVVVVLGVMPNMDVELGLPNTEDALGVLVEVVVASVTDANGFLGLAGSSSLVVPSFFSSPLVVMVDVDGGDWDLESSFGFVSLVAVVLLAPVVSVETAAAPTSTPEEGGGTLVELLRGRRARTILRVFITSSEARRCPPAVVSPPIVGSSRSSEVI